MTNTRQKNKSSFKPPRLNPEKEKKTLRNSPAQIAVEREWPGQFKDCTVTSCFDVVSLFLSFVGNFSGWVQKDGGRRSVIRESELKSEDRGFDPLADQDEKHFLCPSESTLVHTCLDLTPLRVRHSPKFVRTLKIPYPYVVKE